jgi:predicted lipoprotein with Yx(FWY)xxD motif
MVAGDEDGGPPALDHERSRTPAARDLEIGVSLSTKGASMTRTRRITFVAGAAVVALLALALAGCTSDSQASGSAPSSDGAQGTVDVATSGLGQILVDSQGRTLYLFAKDTGTQSECTGACASAWPPLQATGSPTVGGGADASLVATTMRSDGSPQVTYAGHPLYLFSGDQAPGDTNGQGVVAYGASWYAVSPAGTQITGQGSSSGIGY